HLSTPIRCGTFPHDTGKSFFKRLHLGAALIRISLWAVHRRLHVGAAAPIRISLRAARRGTHWHFPLLLCSNRPSSCDRSKAKGKTSLLVRRDSLIFSRKAPAPYGRPRHHGSAFLVVGCAASDTAGQRFSISID